MTHKTIKTLRKQLLYVNDTYRNIEQSLKINILRTYPLGI